MRAFTTRADSIRNLAGDDWRAGRSRALESLTPAGALLQRNAPCACGGGCPRCAGGDVPAIQAKLHVGAPGDAHEREADRVAEHVAGTSRAAGDRAAAPHERATTHPQDAPPVVHNALQGASEPLDTTTRALMESRLGHDFGDVRVNAGELAGRSARALGALAYTSGRRIVFGEGQYAPGTAEGRRLIAHELTHVVQQSAPGSPGGLVRRDSPQKKTTAAPAKFYQYVIDQIAVEEADHARQRKEKEYEFMVYKSMTYRGLKALLPLAEAVEAERTADIPALVDAFIKADPGAPFRPMTQELLVELSARLFMLGLDAEATKLRANFSAGEKRYDWIDRDVHLRSRNIKILGAMVDRAAAAADNSTAQKSKAAVEQLVKIIPPLRNELLDVDQGEVLNPPQHEGFRPSPIREKDRWEGLLAVLNRLVTAISASLQSLVERAANELGTGKATEGTATLLMVRELVETKIIPRLDSPIDENGIGGIKVVLAQTEIKGGKGTIRDAFDEKRIVAVKTYTPDQQYVRSLEAPVRAVFEQRVEQVAVMARVYGAAGVLRADKPAEKARAEDAARNAATLKHVLDAGGKMRLESDDDWRAFVLQKYKDMTTGTGSVDKATALGSIIRLLYDYLGAFTVHARFTDIYDTGDFKDAYFNHPFPRTLSGQLVHDCGVYAMRVAYILSLVRKELGLKFRFARMPAHVGLIITGDALPLYVAHNNHFTEYTWVTLQELYKGWAGASPKPAAADDEQFLAELAAVHFIEGPLDVPVSLSEVPTPGKTAAATQQALWTEYKRITSKDVVGPATEDKKSPNYLFHNRYLAIMDRFRVWHNTSLVPFWNDKAVKSWATFETALKANDRAELTGAELKPLLEKHLKEIDEGLKPVQESLSRIEAAEREISKQLKEDKKLKAPGVLIARGGRLVFSRSRDEYRGRVSDALDDATASPDAKLKVADIIGKTLNPPFVPAPEKSLATLD